MIKTNKRVGLSVWEGGVSESSFALIDGSL